jgi:hypothetical protein
VRRSPWLLLLLVPGCAVFQKPAHDPKPVASLERVKSDPKGVCAAVVNPSTEPWSLEKREAKPTLGDKLLSSTLQACARVQAGDGGAGEGAVVDIELVFPQQDDHWRPEYWHVEVIRQNGVVVLAANLDGGRVEDGVCVLDVCNKEGHATVAIPEPWQADRYRIRLTHVPTRKHVELAITLN